jgi:thioredoxin reductase (NADPH)
LSPHVTEQTDIELDALIVGAGPAGLTAALYLARFKRRFAVIDGGDPRAAWIPTSHNIPFFDQGITGTAILARQREHIAHYGAAPQAGTVTGLECQDGGFVATLADADGETRSIRARRVLLATGSDDIEPDLPDLPDAIRQGLVRYCPICDGYEASGKKIAVMGHGDRGMGEAIFIARTYSSDVTLLTLGVPMHLDGDQRASLDEHKIRVIDEPIGALERDGDRIAAIRTRSGLEHRFEVLYSALGLKRRSKLATDLGADTDDEGALLVDEHNQTSVRGLYAAGGVVRGLDQVVVAMGHAAVAATHIHNRCELPTEEEPSRAGRGRTTGP